MTRRPSPRPTDAELAVLRVLWEHGPSTVREVHGRLVPSGYTTVLKTLQIMLQKGLVTRDESERAHRYAPRVSEETTQRDLVSDLVDRAFRGSPTRLVQQALSGRRATPEEIEELRRLLDEMSEDES